MLKYIKELFGGGLERERSGELKSMGLLNGSQSAEEKELSKETSGVDYERVGGTPFTIVRLKEGTFIAVGSHRVTENGEERMLRKMIKNKDWELVCNTIVVMCEMIGDVNKIKTEILKSQTLDNKIKV